MKKILSISALAAIAAALVSCYPQDEIYKEYVVVGGLTYPAKSLNLKSSPGLNRVVLSWDLPMDPSIRTAKIFWDNYVGSMDVDYAQFPKGHVEISIGDLEERSYTFDVVNYDDKGNKSLAAEITSRPLGSSWLVTHSERKVTSCYMDGDDAVINLSRATDEMIGTKFKVYDLGGNLVESSVILKPEENSVRIPGVKKGKKFFYTSGYYEKNAADTIWNSSWNKSAIGIPYPLPTSSWTGTVTAEQTRSGYGIEKVFDGSLDDSANRWFSSSNTTYRNKFPKILSFDTAVPEGQECYTLVGFDLYQHPTTATYRYMKDVNIYAGMSAYNPDDSDYLESFGEPAASVSVPQTDQIRSVWLNNPVQARYFAITFKNSRSSYGYIDLWELVPYGFLESETE